MADSYFLDTNVLVYAHDDAEPEKRDRARNLIREGLEKGLLVLSAQVLSEFFVTVTQKIKVPLPLAKAREELEVFRFARVVELDADLVLQAVDLRIKHKTSFWGGLVLAAAHRHRCRVLFSEDLSHGQTLLGVRIENPFLNFKGRS
jgi:predicted nucleic acid-binding protein